MPNPLLVLLQVKGERKGKSMKKPFAAIMILLLSLSIFAVLRTNVAEAAASYLTLSDVELGSEFAYGWGPTGSNVTITDVLGTGVEFNFTGLSASQGTGARDDYPVSQFAGGDPDGLGGYGNFTRYTLYRLEFKNQGTNSVTVHVCLNTGYTGSPFNDPARDTFWKSADATIPAGGSASVTLDFSNAICYGATDDPNPAWNYADGTSHPIFRLNETSSIGFEVYGSSVASLLVSGYTSGTTQLYVDPPLVQKEYVDVNSVFEVAIRADEITDLYGFDIKVSWDTTLLSLDHVEYENTSTSPLKFIWGPTLGADYGVQKAETGANYFRLVAYSLRNGFTGSHALFILGFKVLDPQTNSMKQGSIHFEASYDKLSDSNAQSIAHTTQDGAYQIWGMALTIDMTHASGHSRTCRETNEEFIVTLTITNAVNLGGADFEIDYDNVMLSYVSSAVIWGTGTITNDGNGNITGTLTGSGPVSTLATIRFKSNPSYTRMWKDPSIQPQHDVTNLTAIQIQSITLHYPSLPNISYTRGGGGGGRLNVPNPDFSYTFSPIRGDLNNDGKVDITDLTSEASVFDTNNSTMNLIGSTNLIDIFDLVVVAGNFWYQYTPPAP
jgi:hypothetical protein